jgi:hypothetical protein
MAERGGKGRERLNAEQEGPSFDDFIVEKKDGYSDSLKQDERDDPAVETTASGTFYTDLTTDHGMMLTTESSRTSDTQQPNPKSARVTFRRSAYPKGEYGETQWRVALEIALLLAQDANGRQPLCKVASQLSDFAQRALSTARTRLIAFLELDLHWNFFTVKRLAAEAAVELLVPRDELPARAKQQLAPHELRDEIYNLLLRKRPLLLRAVGSMLGPAARATLKGMGLSLKKYLLKSPEWIVSQRADGSEFVMLAPRPEDGRPAESPEKWDWPDSTGPRLDPRAAQPTLAEAELWGQPRLGPSSRNPYPEDWGPGPTQAGRTLREVEARCAALRRAGFGPQETYPASLPYPVADFRDLPDDMRSLLHDPEWMWARAGDGPADGHARLGPAQKPPSQGVSRYSPRIAVRDRQLHLAQTAAYRPARQEALRAQEAVRRPVDTDHLTPVRMRPPFEYPFPGDLERVHRRWPEDRGAGLQPLPEPWWMEAAVGAQPSGRTPPGRLALAPAAQYAYREMAVADPWLPEPTDPAARFVPPRRAFDDGRPSDPFL